MIFYSTLTYNILIYSKYENPHENSEQQSAINSDNNINEGLFEEITFKTSSKTKHRPSLFSGANTTQFNIFVYFCLFLLCFKL